MLLVYLCMVLRSNVTLDFVNELTLFRNPEKLLRKLKREVVWGHSTRLQDKSIQRELVLVIGAQREVHHDMSALW